MHKPIFSTTATLQGSLVASNILISQQKQKVILNRYTLQPDTAGTETKIASDDFVKTTSQLVMAMRPLLGEKQ